MANTISATLLTDILSSSLVTVANNKLANLKAFSLDVSADPAKPLSVVRVRKATAGATVQTDATNFESGNSTLDVISVTLHQYTSSFYVSNADLQSGSRLEHIAKINSDTFCNKIWDVVAAAITTGSFGSGRNVGAAGSFDTDDLKDIYGDAKNFTAKNLLLDGAYLGRLIPTNTQGFAVGQVGAFGFDMIAEHNRWSAAASNTVGFCCAPGALAVATALPVNDVAGAMLSNSTVTIPNIGATVAVTEWVNTSKREHWCSYDIMLGVAAGDTTQGKIITSA